MPDVAGAFAPPPEGAKTFSGKRAGGLMLFLGVLLLAHLAGLLWHFGPEAKDLVSRLAQGKWGETIRLEDPLYRWLLEVKRLLPADASYILLDHYEAGKEIEVRYHLFPRTHHLLLPETPPSRLFHLVKVYRAQYLMVREPHHATGSGLLAARAAGVAVPLEAPGPGMVFLLHPEQITHGFYD